MIVQGDDIDPQIKKLYNQGYPYKEICQKLGINHGYLSHRLLMMRRYGELSYRQW